MKPDKKLFSRISKILVFALVFAAVISLATTLYTLDKQLPRNSDAYVQSLIEDNTRHMRRTPSYTGLNKRFDIVTGDVYNFWGEKVIACGQVVNIYERHGVDTTGEKIEFVRPLVTKTSRFAVMVEIMAALAFVCATPVLIMEVKRKKY